jgi:diguanylate cyclase (GGDEF)-like protein
MYGLPANLEQQLAELNQQYLRRLQQEMPQLQWLLLQFVQAGPQEWREQASVLILRFHTLAGSAGTFGLPRVGSVAKSIELQLKSLLGQQQLPGRDEHAALQLLFVEMQQAAGQPPEAHATKTKVRRAEKNDARILLLCLDPQIAQPVGQTLKTFGHQVERFTDLAQLIASARLDPPDVIIVDLDALADTRQAFSELSALQCPLAQPIPLFVLSSQDEFGHYLQAVRAGVLGYFVKPLNPATLEARLQRLLSVRERDAFRVLIVDDDILLAQHYALVLQNAGLRAEILTEPAEVFQGLRRFHPDVILLDVNMPECSGPELAQAIRLQDEWLGVPIIYLSSETDSERQMASLIKAGDDFLTKPISDNALVVAIFARAQRARQLAEVMTKDSLTGLLQHAHIKERLGAELERAARLQQNVSVAMLDIDHFKKVNDLHGHLTGDQVISSLANLLRQQLRKTDLIGRYGGEEFLIVLPECQLDKACQVVNQLREAFARIPFVSNGQTFHCSFSAGITSGSDSQQVDVVIEHADQALYQAKGAGRNQVILYQPPQLAVSESPS